MADSYKPPVKDSQTVILTKEYIPTKEDTEVVVHEGLEEFCKSRNLFEYLKLLVQLRTQHLQRAMFVSDLHAVFPNNPKMLCGRILFPVFTRQEQSEFKPSKEKMVRCEDFYFDILPPVYY